jgi:hypothetical protein
MTFARDDEMDRTTKLLLAVTAFAVCAYIVGVYVDCATDENCKIEMRRTGPRMIRTAPSAYF